MQRLLLAIILIELPIQMDMYLFHQEEIAEYGAISGLNISLTTVCLVVLYGLWLAQLAVRPSSSPRRVKFAGWPLVAYFLVTVFSVVAARDRALTIYYVFLLFQTLLLFVYIACRIRTRRDVLFVVTLLLVGLIFQSALMIALRASNEGLSVATVKLRIDSQDVSRVAGTIGSPINAASYLCLLLPLCIGILFAQARWYHKFMAILGLSLGSLALALTMSRAALCAFGLSAILLCGLAWLRGWLSAAVPAVLIVLMGCGIFFVREALAERLTGDDKGSAAARISHMRIAMQMIGDHPILGVGANNCAVVARRYASVSSLRAAWFYTIHNKYLLVWVETGVFGLIAFLWFLLATLRRGWQSWQFRDRLLSPIALALSVAIFGQMFHMMVEVFSSRPQVQVLWVVAGLVTAIHNMRGES